MKKAWLTTYNIFHPLGKSDNVCFIINTDMCAQTDENSKQMYAYHSCNYKNINENLSHTDWAKRLENRNA